MNPLLPHDIDRTIQQLIAAGTYKRRLSIRNIEFDIDYVPDRTKPQRECYYFYHGALIIKISLDYNTLVFKDVSWAYTTSARCNQITPTEVTQRPDHWMHPIVDMLQNIARLHRITD